MKTQQIIAFFSIIACTTLISGCATTHQIKITVVDSEDHNQPIGGVDATLFSQDQKRFGALKEKEQEKGRYEGKFPPGQYTLVLKKDIEKADLEEASNGEISKELTEKLAERFLSEKKPIRIYLQDKDYIDDVVPLRLQSAIMGRLIDGADGKGISQAMITMTHTTKWTQGTDTTDSQGVFVIAPLEPGTYRITVTHSSYIVDDPSLRLPDLTKGKPLIVTLRMEQVQDPNTGGPASIRRIGIVIKLREKPRVD